MHTVSFPTPENLLEHFADALDDLDPVAVTSCVNEDGADQKTIAYFETPPDRAAVTARVAILAQSASIPAPDITIAEVPQTDWLEHVYRGLHPLPLGRFYLYGSHEKDPQPGALIPLIVDAATAFGSGHHATTAACLLALSDYAEQHAPQSMLDLGCGAGTLAMGMAKLFAHPVVAVDIDPEAVRVTKTNAALNHCAEQIITDVGDVTAPIIVRHAPYDLIMANILTVPLIEMAAELAAQLAPGGNIILSGLLTRQEADVIAAYTARGLRHIKSIQREDWSALILQR